MITIKLQNNCETGLNETLQVREGTTAAEVLFALIGSRENLKHYILRVNRKEADGYPLKEGDKVTITPRFEYWDWR